MKLYLRCQPILKVLRPLLAATCIFILVQTALADSNGGPVLNVISPEMVYSGNAGFTLSVYGTGFDELSIIRFNGVDHSTTFVDASELQTYIPKSCLCTTATLTVTVFESGIGLSNALPFTVLKSNQVITEVLPAGSLVSGSGASISIFGSGFTNSCAVMFGGSPRQTTFVSGSEVSVALWDGDLSTAGIFDISVAEQASNGGQSNTFHFSVANPVPVLSFITGNMNEANMIELSIGGHNFAAGLTIEINGSSHVADQVTSHGAIVVVDPSMVEGVVSISVSNPGPGGGRSNILEYSSSDAMPSIVSISPPTRSAGTVGFTMHIYGNNFPSKVEVAFGSSLRTANVVSSQEVTMEVNASDLLIARQYLVRIRVPILNAMESNAVVFSVSGSGSKKWKYENVSGIMPTEYGLDQNYPNPFNPTTTITFALPVSSVVTLTVFNSLGQEVSAMIRDQGFGAGVHTVEFDASGLSSGIYYYKLIAAGEFDDEGRGTSFSSTQSMILQR